jgi:protoporphyrinogen/coproporphyrinogen III oxidase
MKMPGVTVIGAGLAGLTSAYRLKQRGFTVKVMEANLGPGGRMAQKLEHGMTYNTGARLCYSFYSNLLELVSELGLEDAIVRHGNMKIMCRESNKQYVIPLKPGLGLLVHPELPWDEKLALLRLLPDLIKARIKINPGWMMTAADFDEPSLAEYLRQKVGPVFLEKFIEPVFRCTRSWNPDQVSPALFISTSAQMDPGSYTFGFQEGMGQLTAELAKQLNIEYQADVNDVRRIANGKCLVRYKRDGVENEIESDIVIFAVEGARVTNLLSEPEPAEDEFFQSVKYNPLGVVHAKVESKQSSGVTFFSRDCSPDISIVEIAQQNDFYKLYCQLTPELSKKLKDDRNTSDIYSVIKESLLTLCPKLKIDEQSIVNQWIENKIPYFYPGYIKKVTKFQGYQNGSPRRIYYCGDYLSQALLEGACQSGNHVADNITKHWLNET